MEGVENGDETLVGQVQNLSGQADLVHQQIRKEQRMLADRKLPEYVAGYLTTMQLLVGIIIYE